VPSDSPTRFVGCDLLGQPHLIEDELVVRFQPGRGTQADLSAGSACQRNAEERTEDRRDLAVRQPRLGVKEGSGGLGIGPT
jgi:hypothetical protein